MLLNLVSHWHINDFFQDNYLHLICGITYNIHLLNVIPLNNDNCIYSIDIIRDFQSLKIINYFLFN